jgi:hypothetical protein
VLRGISNVLWTGRRLLALETGAVSSSVDGLTWDRQSVHLTTPRMLLSGASDGSRTVLVGHDVALWSDDDQTWTEVASPEGWLYDVVWNGHRFIAVGAQDRGSLEYGVAIATSEDGTAWTTRRLGPGPHMSGIARLGDMLVAVGTRGTESEGTAQAVVLTSTDGISWEEHRLGLRLNLLAVESTGDHLVAAATDGTLLWSDDGLSWRTESLPGVSSASTLLWDGEHLLLGGSGIVRLGCDTVPSVLEPGTYISMVPAAANVAGQAGTSWRTDTVLHNPGARPSRCQLYLLEGGQDNTGTLGEPVTVPASGSLGLDDTLPSVFGRTDTSGALLIGCDRPSVVASRTYNDAPQGSFGQLIPGLPIGSVLDQTSFLTGLTHDSSYRTNLGLVSPGPDPIELVVDLWAADGDWLGSRTYDLPGLGWTQDGNAVLEIAGAEVSGAYASIRPGSPAGPYLAYASVIDNASGDPIFAIPARPASQPLYIPAAAHGEGVNQTVWRTDLEVANPGSVQARYTIELLRSHQDNTTPLAVTFELAPGRAAHYPDVVNQLYALDGTGALRVTPDQGSVVISSRTFNQLADGTRGQYIPGFAADTAIAENEQVWLVALRRSASTTTGYRTNIGVASASSAELEVVIELYRADGSPIGTRTLTLAPFEHRQISDALGLPGAGEVELGMARVHSATPGAAYFAYASVADNRSGDPIYIPAVPAW